MGRAFFLLICLCSSVILGAEDRPPTRRVPVIDITDLYHPPQDPGDNFDLIAPYALPEIDLKAVILDVTGAFRKPVSDHPRKELRDASGPREPGVIPVTQLNAIFNRDVPCAVGPFEELRSPEDEMRDVPLFQQAGVGLLLNTLRSSQEKVEIVSFGSARPLAVAYNRDPRLVRKKVSRIHLCAGSTSPDIPEWNVLLDPNAMICLLRSDLPIVLYPCAGSDSPFGYDRHNTFWLLPDLQFVRKMTPSLQSYLAYAFDRSGRPDFLRAMEEPPPDPVMDRICQRPHNVWETAVWMEVSGRKLVQRPDGRHVLLSAGEVKATDRILPSEIRPCTVEVRNDGQYQFSPTDQPTHFWIIDRGDPHENERSLREALPSLYVSFKP